MKYILSALALIICCNAKGQLVLGDSTNCITTTLYGSVIGITPTDAGLYSDDDYSGLIPMGFTFKFYTNNYTQSVIGENGVLCFDATMAGGYNSYSITSALLGNANVRNCICGPWCDIDGLVAAQPIYYSTQGVAPNRTFAVTWCATYMFECTTQYTTTQIICYESSNLVEVHIGHKTICTTWIGGAAIVGVQNAAGTAATAAPGRDYPTAWSATNESWRFTPNAGGTAYTVASIPYAPIPYASSTIYWYDSTTGAYVGSGAHITVTPTVPTTYKAGAVGCHDTTWAYIHVGPTSASGGAVPHINSISSTNPTVCGACNGSITLHGVTPLHVVDSVFYEIAGVLQPIIVDSSNVTDSTITFTGLCPNLYNYFYVKVGNCPSNQVGPVGIVKPPPYPASFTASVHPGCNGDSVILNNTSAPAGFYSYWSYGDGSAIDSATNPLVHIYNDPAPAYNGTYQIVLTYNTTNTHDPDCATTDTFHAAFNHPLSATFTADFLQQCLGVADSFRNTSIGGIVSSAWTWGDGGGITTTSTAALGHSYSPGGNYPVNLTVTDTLGCTSVAAPEIINIVSINVHTSTRDTSVCLTTPMPMHTSISVYGSDPASVTYAWTAINGTPNTDNLSSTTVPDPNFWGVGTYNYLITATTSPFACVATDTETIHSYPPVALTHVTASPQTIPYGSSIQLNADSAVYYTWTPNNGTLDNPNINNPIATPTDSVTVYTVYGMSLYGCPDSAKITVYVDMNMSEFIPSAFTPNNDGLNDIFRPGKLQYQKLVDFRVYNRWGTVVFQTSNIEKGWDGTYNGVAQDMGVYNYEIIVARPDGTQKIYKGDVTLIR